MFEEIHIAIVTLSRAISQISLILILNYRPKELSIFYNLNLVHISATRYSIVNVFGSIIAFSMDEYFVMKILK